MLHNSSGKEKEENQLYKSKYFILLEDQSSIQTTCFFSLTSAEESIMQVLKPTKSI